MKKMYKYMLVIILMLFSFVGEVKAENLTVCEYNAKNGDKIEIRYKDTFTFTEGFKIYVNGNYKHKLEDVDTGTLYIEGGTLNVSTKSCPKNVYYGNKTSLTYNYCFDNSGTYCNEKHKYGEGEGLIELVEDVKLNESSIEELTTRYGLVVPADSKTDKTWCKNTDNCAPICYYSFSINGKKYDATIYYFKGENLATRYQVSASWIGAKGFHRLTNFDDASSNAYIVPEDLTKLMNEGICPANIYRDPDGGDEVCFDNNGGCQTQSKFKDHEKQETKTNFFTNKEQYFKDLEEDRKNELKCDDAKTKIQSKFGLQEITEICGYTKANSYSGNTSQFFVVTENNTFKFYKYTVKNNGTGDFKEVTNVKERNDVNYNDAYTCTTFKQFYTTDLGDNSQWRTDDDTMKKDNLYAFTCKSGAPKGYDKIENNITDCESLLGEDLRNEINSWFLYIKIAVPIILIVMGSLDFGKAFISSDEDAMKKAQKRFIMRLIIAIVIFFIPTIVNILLNIGDEIWNITSGNGTCKVQF